MTVKLGSDDSAHIGTVLRTHTRVALNRTHLMRQQQHWSDLNIN